MTSLVAGLLLGMAGSVHCIGMCGPILVAVKRFGSGTRFEQCAQMLAYHAGRISMYAALGAIAGYAGTILVTTGLGRTIAIVSGVLLIATACGLKASTWLKPLPAAWSSLIVRGGVVAARLVRARPVPGFLFLGLANGLLPCGLLYAAIAASAVLGTIGGSLIFMIGFGLGTVPLLMSLTLSTVLVPLSLRRRIRAAGPVVMALAGTILIVRGILPSDRPEQVHVRHSILSLSR